MTSHSLLAAFLNAHYVVFAPDASFILRIGQYSADLASLMSKYGADSAAVLTAFNPGGAPAQATTNRDAQQSLLNSIRKLQAPYFTGENFAPDGNGPTEPTVVVIGIHREQACALAQQFQQLAFVFSDASATPELAWT